MDSVRKTSSLCTRTSIEITSSSSEKMKSKPLGIKILEKEVEAGLSIVQKEIERNPKILKSDVMKCIPGLIAARAILKLFEEIGKEKK
ncbi:hypothetical protein ES703_125806 [subsurface metagenome]